MARLLWDNFQYTPQTEGVWATETGIAYYIDITRYFVDTGLNPGTIGTYNPSTGTYGPALDFVKTASQVSSCPPLGPQGGNDDTNFYWTKVYDYVSNPHFAILVEQGYPANLSTVIKKNWSKNWYRVPSGTKFDYSFQIIRPYIPFTSQLIDWGTCNA